MADRIVVMKDGHILQAGAPMEIYENPVDIFTARFIGSPSMNLVAGAESGGHLTARPGGPIQIGIRPHDLIVGEASGDSSFRAQGVVTAVEPLGPETLVHFEMAGESVIGTAPAHQIPQIGETVSAHAAPGRLYTFDARTGTAIGRR